ncbi:winged helix-turn-helix domain-containing protein [Halobacteriales archaeon QH_7_65_31]|nr:MAG: winged helix-turn-helix domain-containing protein [Halobacteriales archaeon QH_7_65_31]
MIRRTARWQTTLDERLLEYLCDEGETNVRLLAMAFEVGTGILRDRLRMLAQAGLVAVEVFDEGDNWYELTYWGEVYLEGEYDPGLYPRPNPDAGYRMRI